MIRTLGCIDSGMGGIVTVDALVKAYPDLDIIFIADQKNAPYGDKTKEQLFEYVSLMLNEFKRRNIHDVLIACNTICAKVYDELCQAFPELNLIGIIEPTVAQIKDTHKIGVLATYNTIQSHVYRDCIKKLFPDAQVIEVACPKIAPMIEQGASLEEIYQVMDEYLEPLKGVDACILGCTHYPLVRNKIEEVLNCKLYDSNQVIIQLLEHQLILNKSNIQIYTTLDSDALKQSIRKLINQNWDVEKISL